LKQHALLAKQLGIPEENVAVIENGQVVELTADSMELGERVPAPMVFVDGSGVGDVDPDVMREREELSREGIVLVNLSLDPVTKRLRQEPEIMTRGFMLTRESDEVLAQARRRIIETVNKANGNLQQDVEQVVKSVLFSETRRRPMVFVSVNK